MLERLDQQAIERRVLEAALERLGEGRTDCEGDDNVISIFGGSTAVNYLHVQWSLE